MRLSLDPQHGNDRFGAMRETSVSDRLWAELRQVALNCLKSTLQRHRGRSEAAVQN
jgi:hypothetical protein